MCSRHTPKVDNRSLLLGCQYLQTGLSLRSVAYRHRQRRASREVDLSRAVEILGPQERTHSQARADVGTIARPVGAIAERLETIRDVCTSGIAPSRRAFQSVSLDSSASARRRHPNPLSGWLMRASRRCSQQKTYPVFAAELRAVVGMRQHTALGLVAPDGDRHGLEHALSSRRRFPSPIAPSMPCRHRDRSPSEVRPVFSNPDVGDVDHRNLDPTSRKEFSIQMVRAIDPGPPVDVSWRLINSLSHGSLHLMLASAGFTC